MIHQFRQVKFAFCGLISRSSQFLPLPQLPKNLILITKIGSKIIISLHQLKSVKQTLLHNAALIVSINNEETDGTDMMFCLV
jgi:hypothetical protein